jgi:hypothetical protein
MNFSCFTQDLFLLIFLCLHWACKFFIDNIYCYFVLNVFYS